MKAVADRKRRAHSLIVDERYMRCPRCRREQDILAYAPMAQVEEFRNETVPVYKCPACHWIFAPAHNPRAIFDREEDGD